MDFGSDAPVRPGFDVAHSDFGLSRPDRADTLASQIRTRGKNMRRTLWLVFALSVTSSTGVIADESTSAQFINTEINRLVELYSDGIAVGYPEYRHVKFTDVLPGTGATAVALFSVEGFLGGNLHEEYLAIFEPVEAVAIEGHKS